MHHIQSRALPDESPVAAFYQRHAQMILVYIRPRVPSKEDAEDILVEVFLSVLENPAPLKFSEREQLVWLRRIAHNKMVDRYRRQKRQPDIAQLDEFKHTLLGEDDCEPEFLAIRHEKQAQLQAQLATLPMEQQKVLHLRFAENLSTREIARLLNKSDTAIRSALSRTLNRLRHICEPFQEGENHRG